MNNHLIERSPRNSSGVRTEPSEARHSRPAAPQSALADWSRPSPFELTREHLTVGDVAPNLALRTRDGQVFSLLDDSAAGQTAVLVFCIGEDWSSQDDIESQLTQFATTGARVYLVFSDARQAIRWHWPSAASVLIAEDGDVAKNFGLESQKTAVVVLRSNHRIAGVYTTANVLDCLAEADALCKRLQLDRAPTSMELHPPVLMIPDVFSADECRKLIEVYNTRGQVLVQSDRALNYFNADYKMVAPDHMREDRIDHFFHERATLNFVLRRLQRVEAEVKKAFHYQITHHETLRVARYEGRRQGSAYGHRDNRPPHEHRRFALSVNLNTEEFEGGALRFPEFGDQRYRPRTGMGFVFSSSLLHEAMEVTSGTRYVLLSFMFGDT